MQLVANDSLKDNISESEPILRQPDALEGLEVRSSSDSSKIISAGWDFTVVIDGLRNHDTDADETCNLVSAELLQCRICLDNEGEDLISPCYCKGTQKYVHRSCLDNWRTAKIVASLGILVYKFNGEVLKEMFGYEEHPYGFYNMAILAIVLVGLLYGFFIAIKCRQRINECHYYILAKQELTKEYIVEDMEKMRNVQELDDDNIFNCI